SGEEGRGRLELITRSQESGVRSQEAEVNILPLLPQLPVPSYQSQVTSPKSPVPGHQSPINHVVQSRTR
ncbi:MAG: hypothetical protein ACKPBB_04820, partial [Sphaerospermopsis kisseleviana]